MLLPRTSWSAVSADLGHAPIDDEIRAVDEATLVTGQEDHGVCLLDGLAESTGREMNLASMSFGRIVSQPVLEERGTAETQTAISQTRSERLT